MTVRKPKEKLSTCLTAIAEAKKGTVRTPKDPDRGFGSGAARLDEPRVLRGPPGDSQRLLVLLLRSALPRFNSCARAVQKGN